MKKLVIFGNGQIAELANFYFHHDSEYDVAGFVVDSAYLGDTEFCGKPVVALDEVTRVFPTEDHDAFAAISYNKLNALRAEKAAQLEQLGYELASYISSRATVFADFSAGPNAFILEDNTIQPCVRLGRNVTLWSGNHIGHHSVIEDDVFIASHVVVSGNCRIGERSFVGVNATFRDGITVGEKCIIGMGASILSDCEPHGVYRAVGSERLSVPSGKIKSL